MAQNIVGSRTLRLPQVSPARADPMMEIEPRIFPGIEGELLDRRTFKTKLEARLAVLVLPAIGWVLEIAR